MLDVVANKKSLLTKNLYSVHQNFNPIHQMSPPELLVTITYLYPAFYMMIPGLLSHWLHPH